MTNVTPETGFRLVPCDPEGWPLEPIADLPAEIVDSFAPVAALYRETGYRPPWIGYVALADGEAVGGCGFVGPPADGRVEIGYYTVADRRGGGFATRTARALIAIARAADPAIEIFAKTLPEANPSATILAKLGFERAGTAIDHEIGEAWAWLLQAAPPGDGP